MGVHFLFGYETALEKVGFCDEELVGLLKQALMPGFGADDDAGRAAAQKNAPPLTAEQELKRQLEQKEWELNNARAGKATADDILKQKNLTIDELNQAYKDQGAMHASQTSKLRGEHGAMTSELGRMGKPTRWFGGLSPLKKGLVGGAAGLGTLGLGAGLGYALSGD